MEEIMKPLTKTFGYADRFTIQLKYDGRRYALAIDCADDLTHEEYINFDVCLEAVRRGFHFHKGSNPAHERTEDAQAEFSAELEAEWSSPLPYGFESTDGKDA
jgi:hypothetical protein